MFSQFADKEVMRDIYIAIESLRRSADLIDSHLYEWISAKMPYHDDPGDDWVQRRRVLWMELCVDMVTAELLAEKLQLWWEDDALCILRGAFADENVWEAIASALMAVWRFARFSDSRWLIIANATRQLQFRRPCGFEVFVWACMCAGTLWPCTGGG